MAESMQEEEIDVCDEPINRVDEINALIKEGWKTMEKTKKYFEIRSYCESRYSSLSINNWAGKMKYNEIQKQGAQIRSAVLRVKELSDLKEQELKDLRKESFLRCYDEWEALQAKTVNYADQFVNAWTEYASVNLLKETNAYLEESKQLKNQTMEDMETLCLSSLNTDTDEVLSKLDAMINNIKLDDITQSQKYRLAEGQLRTIKCEIKRVENALDGLKRQEGKHTFRKPRKPE